MAIVNVKRQYYQGKLIAYMKKNESILRYKLCKIDARYLTSNYRVKPVGTLFYQQEKHNVQYTKNQCSIEADEEKVWFKVSQEFKHTFITQNLRQTHIRMCK